MIHLPGRRSPREPARRIHLRGQVNDLVLGDDAFRRHRQHGDVAPVVGATGDDRLLQDAGLLVDHRKEHVAARVHLRARQHALERDSALHRRLRLENLLHRQFRRDPRTAGAGVAGAVVQPHINPQPLPLRGGVAHHLPPRIGEGDQPVGRAVLDVRRPGRADIRHAEDRGPADARLLERLQVARDARFGDVAAHPMPPHARLGGLGRPDESLLGIIKRGQCDLADCGEG